MHRILYAVIIQKLTGSKRQIPEKVLHGITDFQKHVIIVIIQLPGRKLGNEAGDGEHVRTKHEKKYSEKDNKDSFFQRDFLKTIHSKIKSFAIISGLVMYLFIIIFA